MQAANIPKTPQSITVASALQTLKDGASSVLSAVITFTDKTTQNISALAEWVITKVSGDASGTVSKTADGPTLKVANAGFLDIVANYLGKASNALRIQITCDSGSPSSNPFSSCASAISQADLVAAPLTNPIINNPPSTVDNSLFSSSFITLPDIYDKGTSLCGGDVKKINWRMRTANLTKHTDGKKDIVVMMWCLATLGANTQAPIAGGVITFIQDSTGKFSDGTKTLFGVDIILIDGALVTAEAVDLNGDGYDEVMILVTGEDGRDLSSPTLEIYGKKQVALTSNENGHYTASIIGNKTFGDTIKTVQNGSEKQILISGIFGGGDEAFALNGGNWISVSDYDGVSFSGSFSSIDDPNLKINSVIHSDWSNKVYLKKKSLSSWNEVDVWTPPAQGKIPFTSWNGANGLMDYYKFNGVDVAFLAFNINCQIKELGGAPSSTLFMTNAAIIRGGYNRQKLTEGTSDFLSNIMFFKFGVLNNKLILNTPTIRNPLANQSTSNVLSCNPLRGGSEQDIFVATQGGNAKPIVYVRENASSYASVNQTNFPASRSKGTSFTMLYEDIDGDGIPDLIYYPIYQDSQNKDPSIMYKGLRYISSKDLN